MKVKRTREDILATVIRVTPWPDDLLSGDITVRQQKRDYETGKPVNQVSVEYNGRPTSPAIAREWAFAILRACDIAERLEEEGAIVLEGEA